MIRPTVNIKFPIFALAVILFLGPHSIAGQSAEELAQYTGITLPKPETVPGVIVLKTKLNLGFNIQSTDTISQVAKELGAQSFRKLAPEKGIKTSFSGAAATYVLQFSPSTNINTLIEQLSDQPDIAYAEPAYTFKLFSVPDDLEYIKQPYLSQTQLKELLAMPANHDVTVAIIDTGIDATHPELQGHLIGGYNFLATQNAPVDDSGHGTHIAGIIGARINNHLGTAGLNPKSKIISLKIASATGIGSQVAAAEALRYAVDNGARIINCSWGYFVYNQVLKEAIDYAIAQGVIVVAAMGNEGNSLKQFPAGFPGVIAVGAMDKSMNRASFSNIGEHVAFVEEGIGILSTAPAGKTASLTGTSQSAAIITGIASRILSYNPKLTAHEVATIMMLSAEPIGDGQRNPESGNGYIVVEKLFTALNIPSANGFIADDGAIEQDYKPQEKPSVAEPFWVTILLFPYRIVEFLFSGLI